MHSKEPIRYDSVCVDYKLSNGKSVRIGFRYVTIHCMHGQGTPFITQDFDGNNPADRLREFMDERAHSLANEASDGVVHNLSAYLFHRVHATLRGVPKGCIDEAVEALMAEVASKLKTRETMLQFYAVMDIPPPEGFDEFYPPQQQPQQPL